MPKPKLSIIVPTLDEGEVIGEFLRQLLLLQAAKSAEILIIDGGSTDNTRDTVQAWAAKKKNIKWFEAPGGKGIAIRRGFFESKGKNIIFIDADLQYSPKDIPNVLKALSSSDLVVTKRKSAPLDHRRLLSLGFAKVIGKGLLSLPASDPQSGLKGVRSSLLPKLSLASKNWELDAELIKKAERAGAKIVEIEIEFHPRSGGKSKTGALSTSANLLSGSLKLAFQKPKRG